MALPIKMILVPMQREDFVAILREMEGMPVTIRLLDPPLHEFLPKDDDEIRKLADSSGLDPERLRQIRNSMEEFNPMLGLRGARLGISHPEIYRAQARAILEAVSELRNEGVKTMPEIMLPLIGERKEFDLLAADIREVAREVASRNGGKLPYLIGTMIEVPRACIEAGPIAAVADFFSFGTNDLTQMTYGLSRDDSSRFLDDYLTRGIYKKDPFQELDADGVGDLMRIGIERGRKAKQKTRNRRAACPLPQLSGRGILEAVRDASTSFALLTSLRMAVSADEAARAQSLLRPTSLACIASAGCRRVQGG